MGSAQPPPKERRQEKRILEDLWRLADTRVAACHDPQQDQCLLRKLGKQVREILKEDRQQEAAMIGMEVDTLLASSPHPGKAGVNPDAGMVLQCHGLTPPPPYRVIIERMKAERVYLYQRVPPTGRKIPVELPPLLVWPTTFTRMRRWPGRSAAFVETGQGGRMGCERRIFGFGRKLQYRRNHLTPLIGRRLSV